MSTRIPESFISTNERSGVTVAVGWVVGRVGDMALNVIDHFARMNPHHPVTVEFVDLLDGQPSRLVTADAASRLPQASSQE